MFWNSPVAQEGFGPSIRIISAESGRPDGKDYHESLRDMIVDNIADGAAT